MAKKRLVVVRGGAHSCHYQWMDGACDFDLINASYEENVKKSKHDKVIFIKGGKWDGLYRLFQSQPHLLDDYEMVWLPDDDIKTNASAINRMFDLHKHYELALSQPSLSHNSFVLHIALMRNPLFLLRYSDFIEIMMPCFSTSLLRAALPLFKDNRTGQFLDWIWHRFLPEPRYKAAIFDCVAMRHSRAVGSSSLDKSHRFADGAKILSYLENPPYKSEPHRGKPHRGEPHRGEPHKSALLKNLPNRLPRPIFYAGILADGKVITSSKRMAHLVFLGFLPHLRAIAQKAHIGTGARKRGFWFLLSRFFRQIWLYPLYSKPRLISVLPIRQDDGIKTTT